MRTACSPARTRRARLSHAHREVLLRPPPMPRWFGTAPSRLHGRRCGPDRAHARPLTSRAPSAFPSASGSALSFFRRLVPTAQEGATPRGNVSPAAAVAHRRPRRPPDMAVAASATAEASSLSSPLPPPPLPPSPSQGQEKAPGALSRGRRMAQAHRHLHLVS
eukprot:364336-Chlamydomonas_euryale.AAC.2